MHQHRYGGTRASKLVLVHTNGNVSFLGRQNKILLFVCTTTGTVPPGPANLCWYGYCGIRASKLVLVHTEFKDAFLDTGKGYFGSQGRL